MHIMPRDSRRQFEVFPGVAPQSHSEMGNPATGEIVKSPLENLDLHSNDTVQPKYERLKGYLLEALATRRLKPGDVLPPELELADLLGVARNTVRQALAELEREGLLLRVRGKGTFISVDADRRLRRGVGSFALVLPEPRCGCYASLLSGFETAASERRCQTTVCTTENDLEVQANAILQLLDRQADGVALVPVTSSPTPPHQIRPLQQRGIPVVLCRRGVNGVRAPVVGVPFHEIGWRTGCALLQQGHHRVAYFATHSSLATRALEDALHATMREGGGELPEHFVYYGTTPVADVFLQKEAVLAALQQMCFGAAPPTAIFASHSSLTELIFSALRGLRLQVPEDISLIGFGSNWREGSSVRRITSITVDEIALGRKAALLLHEMWEGQRPIEDNEQLFMPLTFTEGTTLAAPVSRR